jgi:hypothetical protein
MTRAASESSADGGSEMRTRPRRQKRPNSPKVPLTASGSIAIDRWMVSVRMLTYQLKTNDLVASVRNRPTIVVLPEIDKGPVEPEFQTVILLAVIQWRDTISCGFALHVELIGLNSLEPRILPKTCHAGDELIGADARVQDGMQGRPVGRVSSDGRDRQWGAVVPYLVTSPGSRLNS